MAGGTIAAHVDGRTREALRDVATAENRSPSQIVSVALRTMMDLSPAARRALYAIDGMATDEERAYAMKLLGRSALKAHERLLDSRHGRSERHGSANALLDTEDAVDAEAIRLAR